MKRRNLYILSLIIFLALLTALGYNYIQKQTEYKQIAGIRYYSSEDMADLAVLCKVWGFLKYYHPAVVEGKYNWDAELIKMMPVVLKANSRDERNTLLSEWVESIGKVQQDTIPVVSPDSVKMYPDLDWIEDKASLGNLSEQLKRIRTAKRPKDKSHYVDFKEAHNPVFTNEDTYPQMSYPDASYRLLALFRYWNIIQYYFPYKYLIGENWDNVLNEFIPQVINVKNELEYKLTLLKLVARIHDSHAYMYDPIIEKYKGNYIVPLNVSFVEGKPVITDTLIDISEINYPVKIGISFVKGKPVIKDTLIVSSEKNYPLKIGDIILKVNGETVDKIISKRLPYTLGSNLTCQLRNLSFDLLRSDTNNVTVSFMRGDRTFIKKISCYPYTPAKFRNIAQKSKPFYRLISKDKKIGYLYLGSAIGGTVPDFMDTKGLIIDLRGYPTRKKVKGYLEMEQLFKKPTKFVKFTSTGFNQPGLFKYIDEYSTDFAKNGSSTNFSKSNFYKGKVIILVNEITQSHAEFVAMIYRCSPTSTIIGSTTAGADGNVSYIPLPGNMQTMITGLGIYYPDGRETQRVGIVPDIVVKPTIKGIREGRDEMLEKAVELIMKRK